MMGAAKVARMKQPALSSRLIMLTDATIGQVRGGLLRTEVGVGGVVV